MVTAAWRRSRPRPCCTSDQGWRTGWPISTTRVAQRRRSSISSVTMRRTMRNMMLRLHLMFTVLPDRSPVGYIRRRAPRLLPQTERGPCRQRCSIPVKIATLILPADTAWLEADRPAPALPKPTLGVVSGAATDQVAAALRSGRKTMMLIRGAALKERGLNAAGPVAAATGARGASDTFAPPPRP